jgi:hypothetical protein
MSTSNITRRSDMPALNKVLAMVDRRIVVNVAALSAENDYTELKAHLATLHESVLEVETAGVGWEEYEPGKVRMPQPSPDCVWEDEAWVCPEATAAPISEQGDD